MMKSTKNTGSKGVELKSPCDKGNYNNQYKSRNEELPVKSKAKKSEKENRICSLKPSVVQKTKSQSKINKTALFRDNRNNTIHKISSNLIYTRRFSRYTDVQKRLKTNKFKSTNENIGKFDENSTNYKLYVNTNTNKKNKPLLKYSICVDLNEKRKTNKRTGLCSDLPGKGTYNHRFAYDQALKLHAQGVDVDVLYKVKNSLDSVYVVNGTFPIIKQENNMVELQKPDEPKKRKKKNKDEAALRLEEYNKNLELEEENRKRLLALEELKKEKLERQKQLKREELIRKQKIREAEREQLSKLLNIKSDENKAKKKLDTKLSKDNKRRAREEQMERDRLKYIDEENRKLMRQKMKQCLALKFQKNNVNITINKLDMNPVEAYDKCEAITDCDKLRAAEKWALQCNGNEHDISWLKTVTCRIDSLGGRVDKSYRNKWMRNALDLAVDDMAEKKPLSGGCTSLLQPGDKDQEDGVLSAAPRSPRQANRDVQHAQVAQVFRLSRDGRRGDNTPRHRQQP
ncbi:Hypothetical protein CINCED_3A024101 [Cinara cedri]|uniref:Uncharacterized protein n=1 Tax=Cinara cedri TaxID=506608 RepID=A0A5E4MBX5_9HEMI|nr:Hypothetical protein CINCED_3A024101 [Cinara cedri]